MLKYTAHRLLWTGIVLLGISAITFTLMHAIPGGPWDREGLTAAKDPDIVKEIIEHYGLDKPLWEQYGQLMWNLLHGDLGISYVYGDRGVTDIILDGLPATFTLAAIALSLALIAGISLGTLSALKQNTWIDHLITVLSTSLVSVPGFIIGIVLMLILAVVFDLLPAAGWGSPQHVVLPALALATFPTALIARVTRASVLDTLHQDHVRTARAKGLPERTILSRHVLRNSLIPILTITGPEWAFLVSGSIIIETLFAVPGIGRLFIIGVFDRDYGLIMGGTMFYAFAITTTNLVVDILYAMVDPRIRYAPET
ncbi:MAG: ABC transporter permease [Chloroflexota bacterium]|nr:ABC transporter permease [Chloroflexota bacterium]